jgi:hypothetical protein
VGSDTGSVAGPEFGEGARVEDVVEEVVEALADDEGVDLDDDEPPQAAIAVKRHKPRMCAQRRALSDMQ